MQTPHNRFKARLSGTEAQIGLWLGLTDPVCIEIAAGAGFDWVCLDGEHSPHDLATLLTGLQTLAAYPVDVLVRLPIGDPTLMKKVLDLGAQTVVVPVVESAAQARALVEAMRYPPRGIRGVGTALARGARWNRATDYFERADAEMCLIVQIETRRGLDNLEDIAAVEGVDGLFIGPADLSASLGHLGHAGHPEVVEAIASAFARIRATGKAAGSLAADEAVARDYLGRGCGFLAVGTDTGLLATATRQLAARFKGDAAANTGLRGAAY